MVFNATFNNISVISWRSFLLAEETGGPGENHRTLSLNVVQLTLIEIRTLNISGIDNDCIDSCKSNYQTITATTAHHKVRWFSPGPPVSSANKNDRHDITEILLKVALNTIKQTNKHEL
jgi:hypothetical protein